VGEALHRDSLSAQLKMADKLNAKYVLILGQKEAMDEQIIVREMKSGNQYVTELNKVVSDVKKKLRSAKH
jgi:histidyl-tRNA synthetase